MRRRRRFVGSSLLLLALLWGSMLSAAGAESRLVAVGDVHGSLEGLTAILQRTGLMDDTLRWVGGDATLVQTGDLLDRGADVRQVLDLMQRLQKEAARAGGEVVVLLGNHEAMNLLGVYRDVNPEMYVHFADSRSRRRQRKAFAAVKGYWRKKIEGQLDVKALKERWYEAHPEGCLEYMEALSPEGTYGPWLRSLPVAVVRRHVLFVHGGTSPLLEGLGVEELKHRVRDEIQALDTVRAWAVDEDLVPPHPSVYELEQALVVLEEIGGLPQGGSLLARSVNRLRSWEEWLIASPEGPLWSRILAMGEDEEARAELERRCAQFGVEHIVVGHTPQSEGRVEARFEGRLLLIDTGMLRSAYGGRPSAVEFTGAGVTAVYEDGKETLLPMPD